MFKAFTFWEQNDFSTIIPPYVLCGIASLKRAYPHNFLLLTRKNVDEIIKFDLSSKRFFFAASTDKKFNQISAIIAKSDFIRFKYIHENGGLWFDADSIVLSDFVNLIRKELDRQVLVWHCEALFGALPGNELVGSAVTNMLESDRQVFANPGNIKDLILKNKEKVSQIDQSVWRPSLSMNYSAKEWDLVKSETLGVDEFLTNPKCAIIKLYNSNISSSGLADMSVADFLDSGTLLSRIFLHLESDKKFWEAQADSITREILN